MRSTITCIKTNAEHDEAYQSQAADISNVARTFDVALGKHGEVCENLLRGVGSPNGSSHAQNSRSFGPRTTPIGRRDQCESQFKKTSC